MKHKYFTKEEFRKIEYEIRGYKEYFPAEVTEVLEDVFDFLRPALTFELPLGEKLAPAIRGLMNEQYPEISNYTQQWQLEWMDEVATNNADMLAYSITQLFVHISTGKKFTAFKDVEAVMCELVYPKEPDLSTMDDYKDWVLTDEQRLDIAASIKESNEWKIAQCEEINRLKAEYVNVVQPILLKCFGPAIDEMNTDLWNHFAINLGLAYITFVDYCTALLYHLGNKNLTVSPGMSFLDYGLKSAESCVEQTPANGSQLTE